MKLKSDDLKKELVRYYQQKDFLKEHKQDWKEESYQITKTFYDEKINEYKNKIKKLHPEWLDEFLRQRANAHTINERNAV